MSNQSAYLRNNYDEVHLRDARHANQFYTANSFEMAPKVKFLYHILFQPTNEALSRSPNSSKFQKEMSMLAKNATLPSYSSAVDTINQYNRKKKYQTKIDYKEVTIKFHDDNVGVSRALLEEYYKYYFVDGNKESRGRAADFKPTDKFDRMVPTYGLDNGTNYPFFDFIKIFQLSRQQWFAYTLVNPIITQWSHDSVDYSEGAAVMENTITVAYEAVMYTTGDIGDNSEPAGFGALETNYDYTFSPLSSADKSLTFNNVSRALVSAQPIASSPQKYSNSASNPSTTALPNSALSKSDNTIKNLDSDTIKSTLANNNSLLNSLTKTALSTGAYSKDWSVENASNYDKLPAAQKSAIQKEVLARATGKDKKMQQLASITISKKGKTA